MQSADANRMDLVNFLATFMLSGCASNPGRGAQPAEGMAESADLLRSGRDQVRATMVAMSALRALAGGCLPRSCSEYENCVQRLEYTAERVSSTSASMKREGRRYFDKWDPDIARIDVEDIRAESVQRRKDIRQSLAEIGSGYADVTGEYARLISNLKDVRAVIRAEWTPDADQARSTPVATAEDYARAVEVTTSRTARAYERLALTLRGVRF